MSDKEVSELAEFIEAWEKLMTKMATRGTPMSEPAVLTLARVLHGELQEIKGRLNAVEAYQKSLQDGAKAMIGQTYHLDAPNGKNDIFGVEKDKV